MSADFTPDDPAYTIIPPGGSVDPVLVEGVVTAISRLFEMRAVAAREEARRAIVEIETKKEIEKFRTAMAELERQLKSDGDNERRRVDHYFATANRLIEQGKDQAAIAVLELMSKEGRISLVQHLIDYHQKVTLGTVYLGRNGKNS